MFSIESLLCRMETNYIIIDVEIAKIKILFHYT